MSATTPNYSFRYPDKFDARITPDRMSDLANDIDTHLIQRLRGPNPSIAGPLHQKITRQGGILGPTLLTETMPWELCITACNAKATPSGQAATNQRLSLVAVYLEKNQVVTSLYKYCTAAYSATLTAMRLSLWTFDGTTFTCVYTTTDLNVGTGYRGLNNVNYTIPASGIYYVGHYYNGAGGGADLGYFEGTLPIASGDFTGGKNNIGLTNNWPRMGVIVTGAATFVGQTILVANTGPAGNIPWIAVSGTLAA